MRKVQKDLAKIIRANNFTYDETLTYIERFTKYSNLTYRQIDQSFAKAQ